MADVANGNVNPKPSGNILHWALGYDLLVSLVSLGTEKTYRENTLNLGRLQAGESALDIGCGTGTLALAAKKRVGPSGRVCGIDASPEMIQRARNKASKSGIDVAFENVFVQELPFSDAAFDVVFSVTMLHHLSGEARRQCFREVHRVLKPGGRFLAVDFGSSARERHGWLSRIHRHGKIDLAQMIPVFNEAGLRKVESGAIERSFGMVRDLHFVLASPVGSP